MTEYVRSATTIDVGDTRHSSGARHTNVYPPQWIAERICDAEMIVTGCRPVTIDDYLGEANARYTHVVQFTWLGPGRQFNQCYLTTFDVQTVLSLIKQGVDQSIVALGGDA